MSDNRSNFFSKALYTLTNPPGPQGFPGGNGNVGITGQGTNYTIDYSNFGLTTWNMKRYNSFFYGSSLYLVAMLADGQYQIIISSTNVGDNRGSPPCYISNDYGKTWNVPPLSPSNLPISN